MPAGSGPNVTRVTSGSIAASEVAVVTFPAQNWQAALGILLSASINFTPGATQTLLTARIRQGSGTGGSLVGIAHTQTTIAAAPLETAIDEVDTSAFGQAQQAGQYTLTLQENSAGPGTVNAAILEIETVAPLI